MEEWIHSTSICKSMQQSFIVFNEKCDFYFFIRNDMIDKYAND